MDMAAMGKRIVVEERQKCDYESGFVFLHLDLMFPSQFCETNKIKN